MHTPRTANPLICQNDKNVLLPGTLFSGTQRIPMGMREPLAWRNYWWVWCKGMHGIDIPRYPEKIVRSCMSCPSTPEYICIIFFLLLLLFLSLFDPSVTGDKSRAYTLLSTPACAHRYGCTLIRRSRPALLRLCDGLWQRDSFLSSSRKHRTLRPPPFYLPRPCGWTLPELTSCFPATMGIWWERRCGWGSCCRNHY